MPDLNDFHAFKSTSGGGGTGGGCGCHRLCTSCQEKENKIIIKCTKPTGINLWAC